MAKHEEVYDGHLPDGQRIQVIWSRQTDRMVMRRDWKTTSIEDMPFEPLEYQTKPKGQPSYALDHLDYIFGKLRHALENSQPTRILLWWLDVHETLGTLREYERQIHNSVDAAVLMQRRKGVRVKTVMASDLAKSGSWSFDELAEDWGSFEPSNP